MSSELLVEREGAIAIVTLNRPERLNALSHDLLVELRHSLRELDGDADVRAVVITGSGRAFSAGADLRNGPSDVEEVLRTYYNPLILEIAAMRAPLVAAVNGVAAGAAVALALACDLRVAAATATFQLSFVKVGLVPDAGATWMLPRTIGTGRAAEMALLGRSVTASEALQWGLVNDVVGADSVGARARELAMQLAGVSRSVAAVRQLLNQGWHGSLADQLDLEASAQGAAQRGPDYEQARRAFAERRA